MDYFSAGRMKGFGDKKKGYWPYLRYTLASFAGVVIIFYATTLQLTLKQQHKEMDLLKDSIENNKRDDGKGMLSKLDMPKVPVPAEKERVANIPVQDHAEENARSRQKRDAGEIPVLRTEEPVTYRQCRFTSQNANCDTGNAKSISVQSTVACEIACSQDDEQCTHFVYHKNESPRVCKLYYTECEDQQRTAVGDEDFQLYTRQKEKCKPNGGGRADVGCNFNVRRGYCDTIAGPGLIEGLSLQMCKYLCSIGDCSFFNFLGSACYISPNSCDDGEIEEASSGVMYHYIKTNCPGTPDGGGRAGTPEGRAFASVGGASFLRWGKEGCPADSKVVYKGNMAGGWFNKRGGSTEFICAPRDNIPHEFGTGTPQGMSVLVGTEYDLGQSTIHVGYSKYDNHDVPCVLCLAPPLHTSSLMVPARKTCPVNWTLQYWGYLMTSRSRHDAQKNFVCVDHEAKRTVGGYLDDDGALLSYVQSRCDSLPCPYYEPGGELPCVVCTLQRTPTPIIPAA